jgi:hypothetical protein
MTTSTCNFYAILKDDSIRKIDLLQTITDNIKNVFILSGLRLLNEDTQEIKFDGNYAVHEEEVLYVEMSLPDNVIEAYSNSIGINVLDLGTDDIKTIFWVEKGVYYFQNFDKRKLLQNKNVIFWNTTTYDKLTEKALIIENSVNAIYKNGKFYFISYANANKIFSLLDFFEEASDKQIEEFAKSDELAADALWLKENANSLLRKQITLIQKSNTLKGASPKKIINAAKKFKLTIVLENGKLKLPNDKKQCKDILSFLNEQYYIGLITGNKYRTNSKRSAE